MNGVKNLSERDKALYRILIGAAQAQMTTPRHSDLAQALVGAGHRARTGDIGAIIRRLKLANRIALENVGLGSSTLVYRIVGSRHRTLARDDAGGMSIGWPASAGFAADAYDDAVARREFAKHETDERPQPIRSVRSAYGAHSLTGCSAAMAVA